MRGWPRGLASLALAAGLALAGCDAMPGKPRLADREKLPTEIMDFGTHDGSIPDDYPDYARQVGQAIQRGDAEIGILICGSGVGAAVAANKLRGIRAALCGDTYSAHQCREHDDCNVLCLGARVVGVELALDIVRAFVKAEFTGEERHLRRLRKVAEMERE